MQQDILEQEVEIFFTLNQPLGDDLASDGTDDVEVGVPELDLGLVCEPSFADEKAVDLDSEISQCARDGGDVPVGGEEKRVRTTQALNWVPPASFAA